MGSMAEPRPAVTVVTPSFNQGKYIRRTVESVLSQGVAVEYLVFDGGSTDGTREVLASFGDAITWVSEPDRGQAHAVNKGLAAARGDVIGWLNSDDVYYPGALAAVTEAFRDNPSAAVVYGDADHIDADDRVIEPYYTEDWDYRRLRNICFLCQPAVFVRRAAVERFGPLVESLHYCMDYEWWLRLGRHVPFVRIPARLAGSRLYPENKTLGSAPRVHREIIDMFRRGYPPVPEKWIYAYAHAVAVAEGLRRDTPEAEERFVRRMTGLAFGGFLRHRRYVTPSQIRTMTGWWLGARRRRRAGRG
jgi:glycosyltransferase involved in cell wall biosynthesis